MDILIEHPNVHLDVLDAWQKGRSACVLRRHSDRQRNIAMAYDGPPALITWTSGTTGDPKGVVIPWESVEARCKSLAASLAIDDISVTTTHMKADHSLGIITSRLAVHYAGGEFVPPPASKITCLIGTPHRLEQISDGESGFNVGELRPSIRLVISSGMPLSDDNRHKVSKSLGARVIDSYASSETGAIAFDGEPLPGCEVKIEGGRVLVKTAGMASGYIGTDESISVVDGWLATCDEGRFDRGKLVVLGRREGEL